MVTVLKKNPNECPAWCAADSLHLLAAAPAHWGEFWPQLLALHRPGDAVILLGAAQLGWRDARLNELRVLGGFAAQAADVQTAAPAPAEATAPNTAAPRTLSAAELAQAVQHAQRVLTWD